MLLAKACSSENGEWCSHQEHACLSASMLFALTPRTLAVRDAFRNNFETAAWYDLGEESTQPYLKTCNPLAVAMIDLSSREGAQQ